jgi:ketosteroid isomerase-like protein
MVSPSIKIIVPEVSGKDKARIFSEATHKDVDFDFSYRVDEIILSGDFAFVRSTVQGFLAPKSMNIAVLEQMKAIHMLKKEEGVWKVYRFMFNSNVPF